MSFYLLTMSFIKEFVSTCFGTSLAFCQYHRLGDWLRPLLQLWKQLIVARLHHRTSHSNRWRLACRHHLWPQPKSIARSYHHYWCHCVPHPSHPESAGRPTPLHRPIFRRQYSFPNNYKQAVGTSIEYSSWQQGHRISSQSIAPPHTHRPMRMGRCVGLALTVHTNSPLA